MDHYASLLYKAQHVEPFPAGNPQILSFLIYRLLLENEFASEEHVAHGQAQKHQSYSLEL